MRGHHKINPRSMAPKSKILLEFRSFSVSQSSPSRTENSVNSGSFNLLCGSSATTALLGLGVGIDSTAATILSLTDARRAREEMDEESSTSRGVCPEIGHRLLAFQWLRHHMKQ